MHDAAAGFGINAKNENRLLQYANEVLNSSDFENCYLVDYVLDAHNDNTSLLYALAEHPEYFGNHIDEVKLVIKNIPLENIMAMGTNKDSMKVSYNGVDYVRFKDLDFVENIFENRTKCLNIYGRVALNTWMGKTSIQCVISDYELSGDESKYDF